MWFPSLLSFYPLPVLSPQCCLWALFNHSFLSPTCFSASPRQYLAGSPVQLSLSSLSPFSPFSALPPISTWDPQVYIYTGRGVYVCWYKTWTLILETHSPFQATGCLAQELTLQCSVPHPLLSSCSLEMPHRPQPRFFLSIFFRKPGYWYLKVNGPVTLVRSERMLSQLCGNVCPLSFLGSLCVLISGISAPGQVWGECFVSDSIYLAWYSPPLSRVDRWLVQAPGPEYMHTHVHTYIPLLAGG